MNHDIANLRNIIDDFERQSTATSFVLNENFAFNSTLSSFSFLKIACFSLFERRPTSWLTYLYPSSKFLAFARVIIDCAAEGTMMIGVLDFFFAGGDWVAGDASIVGSSFL